MGKTDDLSRVRVRSTVTVEYDVYQCGADRLMKATPCQLLEALPRYAERDGSVVSAETVVTT